MGKMDRYKLRSSRPRVRTAPMTDDVAEALEEQFRRFREKFGREPGPDDPVFFDPDAEEPRPMTERQIDEMQQQISEAAGKAGVPPEIIYAMRKTGLIVSEDRLHVFTQDQLDEWNAAIAEYHRLADTEPI